MNRDREFIAQVVIVITACAGAWMLLVQPKVKSLAKLEAQLVQADSTDTLAADVGVKALAARFASQQRWLELVHKRNHKVDDTSSLYAAIMRLASESSIRVQALQPTPARDIPGKPQPVRQAKLEITLNGTFESVSRFIDRVCEIDAFIRPSALHLMPVDGKQDPTVSARLTCEILGFTIDNALASAGASQHAQP